MSQQQAPYKVFNKSHLLINEPALQVLPSLAVVLGLEEAIALQQLHYWLSNVKNEGRVDEEGNKWVYNTYAKWKEDNFPFWSEDKIQHIFLSLEKSGVVISKQLDAKMRDMTKFYRIDYDTLCAMDSLKSASSIDPKVNDVKMNQRLQTETTTDIKKKDIVDGILENLQKAQAIQDACNFFEQTFGFGSLPWDAKPAWRKFAEWVYKIHSADPAAFMDYVGWRHGKGQYKGAMTNIAIRRDPLIFIDAGWPTFLAYTAMYPNGEPTHKPSRRNSNLAAIAAMDFGE